MTKTELCPGVVVYHTGFDFSHIVNLNSNWSNEYIKDKDTGEVYVDLNRRNNTSIDIPYICSSNDSEEICNISKQITDLFKEYENDYFNYFDTSCKSHQPYKLMKYEVGGMFDMHSDDGGGTFRRVSEVFYINDDYLGGEIEFKHFNIIYKPKAGDLIIFPSSYVYMHQVVPVKEGIRYSIASWMR